MTTYTLHPIKSDDPTAPPMVALVGDDGSAFLVGERQEAESARAALARWLENGKAGAPIDEMDERLGWAWVSIAQAVDLAREHGHAVSAPTIRLACGRGKIAGARLEGKTWRFPRARFLGWLLRG